MRPAYGRRLAQALALAASLLATKMVAAAEPATSSEPVPSAAVPAFVLVMVQGAAEPPASLEARVLSWFSSDTVKLGAEHRHELDAASVLRGPDEPGVQVWLLPRTTTAVR